MDRKEEFLLANLSRLEEEGEFVPEETTGFKLSPERFIEIVKNIAIELKNNGLIDDFEDERLTDYIMLFIEANKNIG